MLASVDAHSFLRLRPLLEEAQLAISAPLQHATSTTPVSTTLQCVSVVAALYFSAYLAVMLTRWFKLVCNRWEFHKCANGFVIIENGLKCAVEQLIFFPMGCILFLAVRLNALNSNKLGNPPLWVQWCMYITMVFMLLQFLCGLVRGITEGVEDSPTVRRNSGCICLTSSILVSLYIGVTVLLVSVLIHANGKQVTMGSIVALTVMYFGTHIILNAIERAWAATEGPPDEHDQDTDRGSSGDDQDHEDVDGRRKSQLQHTRDTLSLIPMVCVVMLAARMCADEKNTDPSQVTLTCMQFVAFAMFMQVAVVLLQLVMPSHWCWTVPSAGVEYASIITVYVGIVLILVEIGKNFPAVVDGRLLPDYGGSSIPVSLQCVAVLCTLFFGIYLTILVARSVLYVANSMREKKDRQEYSGSRLEKVLEAVTNAVLFVPMLSLLMIALRLRALTVGRSDAPIWAQHAMAGAVISCILVVLLGILAVMLSPYEKDGSEPKQSSSLCNPNCMKIGAIIVLVARNTGTAVQYVAVCVLVGALGHN